MPRAVRTLLACSLALLVLLGISQAIGATSRKGCGLIESTSIYPHAKVVAIRGVGCRKARFVAKRYDHAGVSVGRWRCFLAHGDRPRLFSCGYPPPAVGGDIRRAEHALVALGRN